MSSCEIKRNSSCPAYTEVPEYTDLTDLTKYHYSDGLSLTLEDTDLDINHYQHHDNGTGCFYVENNSTHDLKLVFIFLTRETLTAILLHYSSNTLRIPTFGVCNTSCDFTLNSEMLSGNCSAYKKLTALVQGRRQQCYNENINISASVKNGMVTINMDNFNLLTVQNVEHFDCRGKSHYYVLHNIIYTH